ncbi:Putative RNA recognition protein, RNP-1 [[Torrubiella] hemipterigena]|nr:Putative RNA recognition protein, RNP-1 [[Torrubiella] hemipterigena]
MFIGGLNWETTDQSLREYFENFGEVVECTVMRDGATGRSRGFGFLTFKDAKTVNIVMVKEHFLDGKIIDPKRAIPRDEQEKTSKIFVGGVSQDTTDQEFREFFAQFGRVVDATLMMDKDTGRPRGFGFVTFENEAGVDACIDIPLEIHGKPVEVKRAQPRGNLQEDDAAKRNKFRKDDQQNNMQQIGANSSMTPQAMAQHFQRMQQYFAMMQSQMAMRNMNPAMWQQMQMQQMQQMQMMGRGNGGNMMNGQQMNPQMMQQMQQMQQMQMQQQQQMMQQGNGGNFDGNFDPSQQQGGHQGGPGGRRGGRGGYNGGGGGNVGWEGGYDDQSQGASSSNQGTPDPQHAPPANAPTGPKNAGRPGANYRGGGRGGSRGFHPYGR